MNRDTLAVIERIILENNRAVEARIGDMLAYHLIYSDKKKDILMGLLECECYEAYIHAITHLHRVRLHTADVVRDPRSTFWIVDHFVAAGVFRTSKHRSMAKFIRFLYQYTDEPWRVFSQLDNGNLTGHCPGWGEE